MSLVWTYKEWLCRWPSLSSDEYWRHTVALPWPIAIGTYEDGDPFYRALVFVYKPWWLCRMAFSREGRAYIRWDRASTRAMAPLVDDDEAWSAEYYKWERIRPNWPTNGRWN